MVTRIGQLLFIMLGTFRDVFVMCIHFSDMINRKDSGWVCLLYKDTVQGRTVLQIKVGHDACIVADILSYPGLEVCGP